VVGFVSVLVIVYWVQPHRRLCMYAVLDPRIRLWLAPSISPPTMVGAPPEPSGTASGTRSLLADAWHDLRRNPVFLISSR
jgi:hypothetical protein